MRTSLPFVRWVAPCLGIPVAIALAACTTETSGPRTAKGNLIREAGEYVSDLRAHGKLPGFSGNEHGREIASAPWKGGDVSYPATVSVRAWKEGDPSTYCYTLVKDAPQSPWQLTKAIRADSNEKLLEQLLPK